MMRIYCHECEHFLVDEDPETCYGCKCQEAAILKNQNQHQTVIIWEMNKNGDCRYYRSDQCEGEGGKK